MPERVKNVFEQLSVGSVRQNIAFYLTISIMLTMVIGQHHELKARDKKPLFKSLNPVKLWRLLILAIKRALFLSKKRSLTYRRKTKAG